MKLKVHVAVCSSKFTHTSCWPPTQVSWCAQKQMSNADVLYLYRMQMPYAYR